MLSQSIFRVQKDKDNPYVMLNKQFLNDTKLSAKAKGILAYLLSLPDDWQIYESEITTHFADGLNSIKSGIKELIDNGYIIRDRIRDDKGRLLGSTYCVYEVSTYSGFSNVGLSNVGESHTTNNNITNNDITKAKRKYTKKPKCQYSKKQLTATADLAYALVNGN